MLLPKRVKHRRQFRGSMAGKATCRCQLRHEPVVCIALVRGGNECGFRPLLPLLFRRCDAGHPDEGEETVLCAEEDGYTSAGGNGAAVLLFLVLSLREL